MGITYLYTEFQISMAAAMGGSIMPNVLWLQDHEYQAWWYINGRPVPVATSRLVSSNPSVIVMSHLSTNSRIESMEIRLAPAKDPGQANVEPTVIW